MTTTEQTTVEPDPSVQEEHWHGVAAEDQENLTQATKIRMQSGARQLLGSLLRPHRRAVLAALVIIVLETLSNLAGPLLVAGTVDVGIPSSIGGNYQALVWCVIGYAGLEALSSLFRYLFLRLSGRVGQDLLVDVRQRVFRHAQRLSLAFHESYTSGKMISRLTNDSDSLNDLLEMGLDSLLSSVLTVFGATVILLFLDLPLALCVLIGFIPAVVLTRWLQRRSRDAYRTRRNLMAKIIVHFVETMNGIRTVQAFRRENRNESIMEGLNIRYQKAKVTSSANNAALVGCLRMIGDLSLALVLTVGAIRITNGTLEIGVLTAFTLYLSQVYSPLDDIASFADSYLSAASALEKLSGVLNEKPLVSEPDKPIPLEKGQGALRLSEVEFRYSAETPIVLTVPELHIPAGQTVALVGATGAGKSTLAKLVARFYDPTTGSVALDNINLKDLSDNDLRRAITTVTQESFMFSGSVADNIAIGNPAASRTDIEAAGILVGAHNFINDLPEGYDTDIRKRGTRLSAGQRQLVALARAVLANPAVLVLDEATSSMDIPSERAVQAALRTVLADRTALIIAHRLSTVLIADRVLVVDGGRIVEDGSPDELIGSDGNFAHLHSTWLASLS